MEVDYDHFTIERTGTSLIRTYYKNGEIVAVEHQTVANEPHPFDRVNLPDDWPDVID